MNVRNVHERVITASVDRVGALLDGLASPGDQLWPHPPWPAMRFDRPLGTGATGGHGPIRYTVEHYQHGRCVRFRFTAPRGFEGTHEFDVAPVGAGRTRLRHTIDMRTSGRATLRWPLVIRPLHDALIEDLLDRAERSVGAVPRPRQWSLWVRALRRMLGRPRRQLPTPAAQP